MQLALAQHNRKLSQAIGGLLPHSLALNQKHLANLLQDVIFINQIVLLDQQLAEILENLSHYLKALLLDLFLAHFESLRQLWVHCPDHIDGGQIVQLVNNAPDGQ